ASILGPLVFQRASVETDAPSRVANTNRVIRFLLPIALLGAAVTAVLAPSFVDVVYGGRFHAAGLALILLLPGLVCLVVEVVLMSHLGAEGNPPIVYWAPLAGMVFNVSANMFVIP